MEAIEFIIPSNIFKCRKLGNIEQLFTEVEVVSGGYLLSHAAAR